MSQRRLAGRAFTTLTLALALGAEISRAATPYKIAETHLAVGGVTAVVDAASLVVPKGTASAVRIKVFAGDQVLDAQAVRDLVGGPFSLRAELFGPGLAQTVSLPLSNAPVLSDPFLIPVPPLATGGDYVLTGVRLVANGQPVLDAAPTRATFRVIDQVLITSVKTQSLTPDQMREKGIVLGPDAFVGFQFTLALMMESQPVEISLPVAFDRQGLAMPPVIPLPPPITRPGQLPPVLPYIAPVLLLQDLEDGSGGVPSRPELTFPDGVPVRIPSVLVIPGDVSYLKEHFSAQLFVANGTPLGTGLQVHDVTGTIRLPLPNPDPAIVLAPTVRGPQPETMPVLGVGPDDLPGTADDVHVLGPGEQGRAEFLLRAEKEGFHRLEFDVKAELDGLPVGPVTVRGKAKGGVLVRNPRFSMSFTVPTVVRDGERFSFFATVTNIGSTAANTLTVNLDTLALSGADLVCPSAEPCKTVTIPQLLPGDATTIEFVMDSRRTGAVVASYIDFSDDATTSGGLNFTLGVGERGILHSPDTLVLPTGVEMLPAPVVRAAMRVLGQAWSIATAPADRPIPGVTRINANVVRQKAHALAEAGLRVQLNQAMVDAVRDLALDLYGGSLIDPGFDELLRQTRAGRDLAHAIGAVLQAAATSGAAGYERALSEVMASGADFLALSVSGIGSPVQATLSDGSGRKTASGRSTTELALSQVPSAAWIPLGAPASAPFLGWMTAPHLDTAYTLEVSAGAELSLTLPRVGQSFLRVTATTSFPARAVIDLRTGSVAVNEDRYGDGTYEATLSVAASSLASPGPQLVSATILGAETLPLEHPFGMNAALLFDRVVDGARAADRGHYRIPSNTVSAARAQLSGRIVFLSLDQPEGKYVPTTVTVDGMADARGVLGSEAVVPLATRMVAPGGVVSGHVLNADGTPYAGARVFYLNAMSAAICIANTTEGGVASTTTGPDGRYEFRYVKQDACGGPFRVFVRDPVNGAERSVWTYVRTDGEQIVLDLALLGRGALQGTVRNGANVPVAGARVVALSVADPKVGGAALTDASGHYAIYNLPVGALNVTAGHGIHMGKAAGRIDRAGETTTVDVRLESGAARISGRVFRLDPGQTVPMPLPGIHVIYYLGNGQLTISTPILGVAQTDATGKYVLEGMPSGNFTLKASLNRRDEVLLSSYVAEEQALDGTDLIIEIPAEDTFGTIRGRVSLPSGSPAEGVVVEVDGRGVLTGADGRYTLPGIKLPANPRVNARTRDGVRTGYRHALLTATNPEVDNIDIQLSGIGTAVFTVLSPSGQPIRGQTVSLMGGCNNPCGCASKVTGTDGTVSFPNRRMGGVAAMAVRPGLGATDVVSGAVTLSQDGVSVFGVLRFAGVGTVSGLVKDSQGQPLQGASVSITANQFKNDGVWVCGLEPTVKPEIRTGPDGRFTLPNVNAGAIRLTAHHEFTNSFARASGTLLGGDTLDLTVELANTISGRLTGTVFLPDGTTPAGANVELTLNGPLPDVTVRTNAAGQYAFPEILPAGRYTMTVRDAASGGLARSWVYLRAGQTMTHDVRLLGKGTIVVRVVDAAGRLAENALVRVTQSDYPGRVFEGHVQSAINDGLVTFSGAYEGPFSVAASDVYGRGGRLSATLAAPGDTAEVKVTLSATGSVKGRFLMPNGTTPIPFGTIRLLASGRVVGQATSSGSGEVGSFTFNYVPAGPVRIEASDPATARTGFAVATLETQDQEIAMDVVAQGLGTVQGTVTSNGAGQPSALVEVVSGAYRTNTMADGAGVYSVSGVPEGRVTVTASLEGGLLQTTRSATLAGDGTTATIDIALRPTGAVVGAVTKADGVTAALSVVSLQAGGVGGGRFARTTSVEGAFQFARVPAGGADVLADALGTIDQARTRIDVPAGETLELPIRLNGVGSLRGRALSSAGGATDGTLTVYVSGAFPSFFSMQLGPDGLFQLPEVLAGPFTARLVTGSGPLALYGTATGTIAPDQETVIDVQLQPSGTVTGLILRPDGVTPAYGANVTLEHERGSVLVQAQSDGRFTLKGVPLGHFKVKVKDDLTTGLATLRGQELTQNGQVLDVGTLVLDDAPPSVSVVTPIDGSTQSAVGAVLVADFDDVGSGVDTTSMYVRFMGGGNPQVNGFTFEGQRVRGAVDIMHLKVGVNTFWVGIRDLAGNLTEKKVVYTSVGATVRGVVRWSDGQPVGGAVVDFGAGGTAVAGTDGSYSRGGLRANGWVPLARDPVTRIEKRASVLVYDGEDSTLDITLPAHGFVRGVVRHADGSPAAGVKVQWHTLRETTSGPDGTFDLGAFELGSYSIEASDARGDRGRADVTLSSPGQIVQVPLRLIGVGRVTVLALDGETPLVGLGVSVRSSAFILSGGSGTSGSGGTVVFDQILAGTVTATVTDVARNLSGRETVVLNDGGAVSVTVRLAPSGRVEGTVRRADGTPAANVEVTLVGTYRGTVTDPAGHYAFDAVTLGAFNVRASVPGSADFAEKSGTVFTANSTVIADMTLNGFGTLRVTVKDASDAVVPEAQVSVYAKGTPHHKDAGLDGVATFENMLAGPLEIVARKGALTSAVVSPTLAGGGSLDVVVTLRPAGTVRGRVWRPDGVTPADDAMVWVAGRAVATQIDGSYEIGQLTLGTGLMVRAHIAGRLRAERTGIPLTAEAPLAEVDLVAVGVGTVTGVVRDTSNAVVPNLQVTLYGAYPWGGAAPFLGTTGPDGRYTIERVPVGSFTIGATFGSQRIDAGGELAHDGEVVTLDLNMVSSAVSLPANFKDGNLQSWAVNRDGNLTEGSSVLHESPRLTLVNNGTPLPFAPGAAVAASEENQRELIVSQALGGLNVTRKIFLPKTGYFVRFIDLLENAGSTPITVDVLERAHAGLTGSYDANVVETSSGDSIVDASDRWVTLDATEDDRGYDGWQFAPLGFVFAGPGGQGPDQATFEKLGAADQYFSYRWNAVTVAPGQRVAFLHVVTSQSHRWRARATVERLGQLPPELLVGMSADEGAMVRNFAVPEGLATSVPPLAPLDGRISGRVLGGDGEAEVRGAMVTFESGLAHYGRRYHTQATTSAYTVQGSEAYNYELMVPREPFDLTVRVDVLGAQRDVTARYDFPRDGVRNLTNTLGTTVQASSSAVGTFGCCPPALAVDNDLNTRWAGTATDRSGPPHFATPYIEVRLSDDATIHMVKVRGLRDGFDGIRRANIELRDAAGNVLSSQIADFPMPYRDGDVAVDPPVAGVRTVRLVSLAEASTALTELEVWGEAGVSTSRQVVVNPRFEGYGVVAGRVLRTDGTPVASAPVRLLLGSASAQTSTDASGAFVFPVVPPASQYVLEATHPLGGSTAPHKATSLPFDVEADQRAPKDVVFPAFGTVSVAYFSALGQPVLGQATLVNTAGYAQSQPGNAATTFTFVDVPPGEYDLSAVDARSNAKLERRITVSATTPNVENFTFPVVGTVDVVARLKGTETPVAGAPIYWRSPDHAEVHAGAADGIGRLRINNVSGPTFTVKAAYPTNAHSFGEASGMLSAEGDHVTVIVDVPGLGTVSGVVRGRDGAPVTTGTLSVTALHAASDTQLGTATPNAAGAFTIPNLPVGPVRLRAYAGAAYDAMQYDMGEVRVELTAANATLPADALVSRGVLAVGQRDLWIAQFVSGASVTFSGVGLGTTPPDLYLEIYGPDGARVASNDNRSAGDKNPLIMNFTIPAAGEYVVSVRAVGSTSGAYRLGGYSQLPSQVLRLPAAAAVHGSVIQEGTSAPVAGVTVRLTIAATSETKIATTASDGTYLFPSVPAETVVTVQLLGSGNQVLHSVERTTGAAATGIDVPLTRPGLGSVTVRSIYHGQPHAVGLLVTVTSNNATAGLNLTHVSGVTGPDASLHFDSVAVGTITATATDPNTGLPIARTGALVDQGTLQLDLPSTDVTAPAAITTLSVASPSMGVATLTWTAPGDDGTTGTAAAYDLRYSTSAIDAGNFAAATALTAPAPTAPGTTQSVTATLPVGHTYFFAIQTHDAVNNASALSNVPSLDLLDSVAPAAVTDLTVTSPAQGVARLRWTAPGDDGTTGVAHAYEIRTSTAPVTEGNFAAADPVLSGVPLPAAPGTPQSVDITLPAGHTYYFALKTSDERPNWSSISNTPSFELPDAFDGVPPAAITDLSATSPEIGVVSLSWTSPGDDGTTGTAAAYDIRYANATITEASFTQATPLAARPAPAVAGTTQGMQLTLPMNQAYSFAARTRDEADNWSPLSNIATVSLGDVTPPAAVSNLAAVSTGPGIVAVSWTAPGDDGAIGIAVAYDLRYSTAPITEENFLGATPIEVPAPLAAGTSQIVELPLAMQTYYFALKTRDEVPNWSPLSNAVALAVSALPPGVRLWVKADAGITQDEAGFISAWADQSGNGNHLLMLPPLVPSATPTPIPSSTASLQVNGGSAPIIVAPGASVTVNVAGGPGFTTDRVVVQIANSAYGSHTTWQYLNGLQSVPATGTSTATLTFTMPTTPGIYHFRFLQQNGSTLLATSPLVTVYPTSRPRWRDAEVNGRPVVRFDGVDDYLKFNTRLTGVRTVFWAIREAAAAPNGSRNLLGDNVGYTFYGGAQHQIWETNNTSAVVRNGETYLNGNRVDGTVTDRPANLAVISVVTTGDIAADAFSRDQTAFNRSWLGDLAELIIYERALSAAERKAVEDYLAVRYASFTPIVDRPLITPNGGRITAPTTVTMAAAVGSEIRYTTDGSDPTSTSTLYTAGLSVEATTTVKAKAFLGTRASVAAVAAFVAEDQFHPAQVSGLKLWVRADAGIQHANGRVSQWTDVTGANGSMTQTNWKAQPTLVTSATTGKPALRFDGTDDYLQFPSRLTTIRTVYWVVHENASAPNGSRFLLGDSSNYDFSGGAAHQIWENQWANASIKNGDTRLNGVWINGTTTNRPTTPSVLSLVTTGAVSADSFSRDRGSPTAAFWNGELAELIVYDRVLTATERKAVDDYLALKYNAYTPALNAPKVTPNGGVFSGSASISITATPGASIRYTTDGTEPTTSSLLYTGPLTITSTTTLKAKAFQSGWATSPTSVVGFTSNSTFHPGTLSGLRIWVRADAGVDEVGGFVSRWSDQSGTGNDLTQASTVPQPTFLPSGVDAQPTLRFDGVSDFLAFTTRLTTIRTVFWVVHENASTPNSTRYLLGDSSNYDFSGGAAHQIWDATWTSPSIKNGTTRLNGAGVNGTTTNRPTTPSVLSVVTTGAVAADSFSRDRGSATARWSGDLAELVIYDRALTDAERLQVEQYLGARHGITIP